MSPVIPPVGAAFATTGPEWSVGQAAPATTSGGGFGGVLSGQLQQLQNVQNDATQQSQALATGTATDPNAVVMAVERAQLSMQMASTLRNKGVEAMQEILRTQV